VPQSSTTQLASGQITNTDELVVELVEQLNLPPLIAIKWPAKATVCTPAQLDAVVATTMRLLANSVVELAAIKVWKKL
jgi:hypothetical protein